MGGSNQRVTLANEGGTSSVDVISQGGYDCLASYDPIGNVNALKEYAISDTDDDAEPNYFGYIKADGAWYILKEESNTYRYVAGSSAYTTAWAARTTQSYDYFNEIF